MRYVVSITNPSNYFEVVRKNFEITPGNATFYCIEFKKLIFSISPGKIHSFHVVANEIGTTEEFNTMSFKERNCRLPHETHKITMFKTYSKSGCEFECATNRVADICLCKPWSVPRFPEENIPYCDMVGNMCFYQMMTKTELFENCSCDEECQSTNFNIFYSSSQLDLRNRSAK